MRKEKDMSKEKNRGRVEAAWREVNRLVEKQTSEDDPPVVEAIRQARQIAREEGLESWRDDGVLAMECGV